MSGLRPRAGPRPSVLTEAPGMVLACLCAVVAVAALLLMQGAGRAASLVSGRGWSGPDVTSAEYFRGLAGGPAGPWPDVAPGVIYAALALELVVLVVVVTWALHRWQSWSGARDRKVDPAPYLARVGELEPVALAGVRRRALHLRPRTLAGRRAEQVPPAEAGWPIGVLRPVKRWRPQELRGSWEDVAVCVMAPRSGKTTAVAVPTILDAPGAVVATSNKADLWAATAELRWKRTGQEPWVFDPMGLTTAEQSWWWNPLDGITSYAEAHRLARHFFVSGDNTNGHGASLNASDPFWQNSAHGVLAAMMLAAAVNGGTLLDVWSWVNDPSSPEPSSLLRRYRHLETAEGLDGARGGAVETRGGIWQNARTAILGLQHEGVRAWVAPTTRPERHLDVDELVRSTGATLYLLSSDDDMGAKPIVAALTERVCRAAEALARRQPRQRLDPPIVLVLDEAANICRIPELPRYMSHFGSKGIIVLVVLQSRPQARGVWGREGFDAMWNAATVKLVGAGIDDPELQEELSQAVGEHDVHVHTLSYGHSLLDSRGRNHSETVQQRRILRRDDIRALPKGTGLLLVTGCRPGLVQLQPWYEGPRAREITAALDRIEQLNTYTALEVVR